ncbi:MAG: hypothetical protein IJ213_08565 [Bacteroidales bacterium]|nr:hypothetical protein [Bacteroidales bacterium]
MIDVKIFGVPHGFDCSEGTSLDDMSYYRSFYDSSKDDEKYVVHFRYDGKVIYNYLSYDYFSCPENRPGAFIGISLVLDRQYHPDFLKVFRLLRLVFKEVLVKSGRIINGKNFVCRDFSHVTDIINSIKESIINNIAKDPLLPNNIKIQGYTKVYSIKFPKDMQEAENNQALAQSLNAKYLGYIAKYSMLSFSGVDYGKGEGKIVESPIIEKHKRYTGEIANEFIANRITSENISKLNFYIGEFNSDAKNLEKALEVKQLIEQYNNLLKKVKEKDSSGHIPPNQPKDYTPEQKKILENLEYLEDKVKEYDISVSQGKSRKELKYILTLALKDKNFEALFVQLNVKKDKDSNWAKIYDKASIINRIYEDRLNAQTPNPNPIDLGKILKIILPILAVVVVIFLISKFSFGSKKDYTKEYNDCLTEIQKNLSTLEKEEVVFNETDKSIFEGKKYKIVDELKEKVEKLKEHLDQDHIDALYTEIYKIEDLSPTVKQTPYKQATPVEEKTTAKTTTKEDKKPELRKFTVIIQNGITPVKNKKLRVGKTYTVKVDDKPDDIKYTIAIGGTPYNRSEFTPQQEDKGKEVVITVSAKGYNTWKDTFEVVN